MAFALLIFRELRLMVVVDGRLFVVCVFEIWVVFSGMISVGVGTNFGSADTTNNSLEKLMLFAIRSIG